VWQLLACAKPCCYLACVPVFVVLSCVAACMYVCIINVTLCDCHAVLKGDYYYLLLVLLLLQCNKQLRILSGKLVTTKKEMSPIGDTICPLSVADNH